MEFRARELRDIASLAGEIQTVYQESQQLCDINSLSFFFFTHVPVFEISEFLQALQGIKQL